MKEMKKFLSLVFTFAMLLSVVGTISVSAALKADSVVTLADSTAFHPPNQTTSQSDMPAQPDPKERAGTGEDGACLTYTGTGLTTYVGALLPEAITSGKADISFDFNNEMTGGQLRFGIGEENKNWNEQTFITGRVHVVTFLPEIEYGIPATIGGSTGAGNVNIKDGYSQKLSSGWHDMDISVDLTTKEIKYYVDGAYVHTATLNDDITQIHSLPMLVTSFSGTFSIDNLRVKYASGSVNAQEVTVNTADGYIEILPDETIAAGSAPTAKLVQCGGNEVAGTSTSIVGDKIRVDSSTALAAGREYYIDFAEPLTSIYGHTLKAVTFNTEGPASSVVTEKKLDFTDFTQNVTLSQNQTDNDGTVAVADYVVSGQMADSSTAFSIDASTINNTNETAAAGKAMKWGLASDQVANACHWLRFIDMTKTASTELPSVEKRYIEFDMASNSNTRMYLIGADRHPTEDESQTTNNYQYVMLRAGGTGTGINLTSNEWHHIKIEIDNTTNTGTVYVNGSTTASTTLSYSSPVYGVSFRNTLNTTANYIAFDNWHQYYVAEAPVVKSVRYCAGAEKSATNEVSPLTESIEIEFSAPMDETSLDTYVTLTDSQGGVAFVGDLDAATGKIYTLDITAGALNPEENYTLTVGTDAKTAGGVSFGQAVVYSFATTAGVLELSDLAIYTSDAELTTGDFATLGGVAITVQAASKNATGAAPTVYMIFAAYYDNELVDVQYDDVTVPLGTQTVSVPFTVKSGINVDTVKAFLWEDIATLKPILAETEY